MRDWLVGERESGPTRTLRFGPLYIQRQQRLHNLFIAQLRFPPKSTLNLFDWLRQL